MPSCRSIAACGSPPKPACRSPPPCGSPPKPPCAWACAPNATKTSAIGSRRVRIRLGVLDTRASASGDDLHPLAGGEVLPAALHHGDGLPVVEAHDDFFAVLRRAVAFDRVAGEAAADRAEDRARRAAAAVADGAAEKA